MGFKKDIQARIIQAVETVKQTNPMAGSVTNSVTINFVANAQLAVGGSAAMVYLPDEAQFLVQVHFLDALYKAEPREIADNPFDIEEV